MFIYSGDNSDPENNALGKTDMWPVIVKGIDPEEETGESTLDFEGLTASLSVISDEDKEIRENIEADIEYIDLEGGFYAIKSEQGNFLPVNIQEDLKANVGDTLQINRCLLGKRCNEYFYVGNINFRN